MWCLLFLLQGLVFKNLHQIIPGFLKDFPGGVVMVIQHYSIIGEWSDYYDTKKRAKSASVACVRLGEMLDLNLKNHLVFIVHHVGLNNYFQ